MINIEKLKDKYKIDIEEFRLIEDEIIKLYTRFIDSVNQPKTIILGAQPGSGKSELEKIAFNNLSKNAVICNVDNLKNFHPHSQEIKKNHPEYFNEFTSSVAHQWNLALRRNCIENNYNFILETTFSEGTSINSIIENLKKNKFQVEIYLLSVPEIISKLGIVLRYEEMLNLNIFGRKVSIESHDQRFKQIPQAIKIVEDKKLYDYINLYGRSLMNLNSKDEYGVYLIAKTKKNILEDYLAERDQKINRKAESVIYDMKERIIDLMIKRDAPEEEISVFSEALQLESINTNSKSRKK